MPPRLWCSSVFRLALRTAGVFSLLSLLLVGSHWFAPAGELTLAAEPVVAAKEPKLQLIPPANGLRLPAEFEPQERLLLAGGELTEIYAPLYLEIVRSLHRRVKITTLVSNRAEREWIENLFKQHQIDPRAVEFAPCPHNTIWVRDYGPLFLVGKRRRILVDADYSDLGRAEDDRVPAVLSRLFQEPIVATPASIEGGNILSNGRGLILTTTAMFDRNLPRKLTRNETETKLRELLVARQVLFLEPLAGEPTGHVDMFAAFTGPYTVVVGQGDEAVDPVNAALLDRNAGRLAAVTIDGVPLRVERIPMPPNEDRQWRTYTNALMANGVMLVPTYPDVDPQGGREAIALYRQLLPHWEIRAIDASGIITVGGALHCLSTTVPALDDE